MNLQTLKSGIVKGQKDLTKEAVVIIANKEYVIDKIVHTIDKVLLSVTEKIPTKVEVDLADLPDTVSIADVEDKTEKEIKTVIKKAKAKKDGAGSKD